MDNLPFHQYDTSEFLTSWNEEDVKGCGNFACVRKCEHHQLGNVVVKCFKVTGSSRKSKEALKEIEREVSVLFRLHHKNIVQILGTTQWVKNIGIVMECVDGGNLEDLLMSKDIPNIPWLLRLRIYNEMADGLTYLHHYDQIKAFVHSDLKPQNILLTPDLMVKIADFGSVNIAIETIMAASSSIKFPLTTQHTPFYAAPEILKNSKIKRKPLMDVYSFAMVGYETLTRHQVFEGSNINIVIQAIIDRGQKPDSAQLYEVEKSLQGESQNLQIFKFLKNIMIECWDFEAENRPDIRDIRNRTAKELMSLGASKYFYHINKLRVKRASDDKPSASAKIPLSKIHYPFEEGPIPAPPPTHLPNSVTETSTSEKLAGSLTKPTSQFGENLLSIRPLKTTLQSDDQYHKESNDKKRFIPPGIHHVLLENDQLNELSENVFERIKQFLLVLEEDSASVRNGTTKALQSVGAPEHSYRLNNLKIQSAPDDKPSTSGKTPLTKKFYNPSRQIPLPLPNHLPSTNIPTSEELVGSSTKPTSQSGENLLSIQRPIKALQSDKDQHYEACDDDKRFASSDAHQALVENHQQKEYSENLLVEVKLFSYKEEWDNDAKYQLLSLWVQLRELNDPSLLKRAAKYFPTKLDLWEIHLSEEQVISMSAVLKYTTKYIEIINLYGCHLCTSSFRHFSTALMMSDSKVGLLDIRWNQLEDVSDILNVILSIKDRMNLFYAFTNGCGGRRHANTHELRRIQEVLNKHKSSLKVVVAGSIPLRSQRLM